MNMRTNIWGFALATALVQSADWLHLGRTTDYDVYIDSSSIQPQTGGRVAFRVKREYSHDENGEPFGAGGVAFVAIGDLIADCARRTVSVVDVTIQRSAGQVLTREKAPHPTPVTVDPGSAGEAELEVACGHPKMPAQPHH